MPLNWEAFYLNTKEKPPSPLLVKALAYVTQKGRAIDVGAGALKDSKFLLSQGFEVTALDRETALEELARALGSDKLHVVVSSFADFDFPEDAYDLINASYSLPFNNSDTFKVVFEKLKKALSRGGVFCGQFFGHRDAWHANPDMTFHSQEDVETLLNGLELIQLDEREWDGKLADGSPKHWHVFDVIASKR